MSCALTAPRMMKAKMNKFLIAALLAIASLPSVAGSIETFALYYVNEFQPGDVELLAKRDGDLMMFYSDQGEYQALWNHPEYDAIDIGGPVYPMAEIPLAVGTVMFREYDRGKVYVNHTRYQRTLVFDEPVTVLDAESWDKLPKSVTQYTMEPHRAAIVVPYVAATHPCKKCGR